MDIQNAIRTFLPSGDHFYGYLELQSAALTRSAAALSAFGANDANAAQTRDAVDQAANESDLIMLRMEEALARTIVTPVDREDLLTLSTSLDRITGRIRGAALACLMLDVSGPSEPMMKLIDRIAFATAASGRAFVTVRSRDYTETSAVVHVLKESNREAETVYEAAVSVLIGRTAFDPTVEDARLLIRDKTVLDELKKVVTRFNVLGEALLNHAVKHA